MSVYGLNKLLYRTERDEEFRRQIQADPEKVLSELSLSDQERKALTTGDLHEMFQMGVHPFLLNHMPRHGLFGVTRENYLPGIRGEQPPPS